MDSLCPTFLLCFRNEATARVPGLPRPVYLHRCRKLAFADELSCEGGHTSSPPRRKGENEALFHKKGT